MSVATSFANRSEVIIAMTLTALFAISWALSFGVLVTTKRHNWQNNDSTYDLVEILINPKSIGRQSLLCQLVDTFHIGQLADITSNVIACLCLMHQVSALTGMHFRYFVCLVMS